MNTTVDPGPRRSAGVRSLRAQLLIALIILIAAVCLIVGVSTTEAVVSFQVAQLDDQLRTSAARYASFGQGLPGSDAGPPIGRGPLTAAPGQAADTLVARLVGGQVREAGRLDQVLPERQYGVLTALPVNSRPYTRHLDDFGDYRLIASRSADGDVLITGRPLAEVYATRKRLIVIEIAVGLGALLLAGLAGAWIVRRKLRPLDRVAAIAGQVAELQLDRGEVALSVRVADIDTDPRTEVGQVGAAINRMLGHVAAALAARQDSETRVRHFVADASHELRTPLAAIRGYAELTRRLTDSVPDDVAYAMRRVESETARMTTLVEDLLLLARLDSGRPLAQEPVDLSLLVIDAVNDAHVAAADHHWSLNLPDEPVIVTGDRARLHQVLANLLANARTHTPPGTTVATTLIADGGRAVLSVVDDGPGIPADLLPDVFERFARGDTSRSRAAGSTGLGLAIVAAVVDSHHGDVKVSSQPGATSFTVLLPMPVHS